VIVNYLEEESSEKKCRCISEFISIYVKLYIVKLKVTNFTIFISCIIMIIVEVNS